MAQRVSQIPVEVAGVATSHKIRVSQIPVEVGGVPTSNAVRVSQLVIEVSAPFQGYHPTFEDSLNNFNDYVQASLLVPEPESTPIEKVVSSAFEDWADSVGTGLVTFLSEEVASSFELTDGVSELLIGVVVIDVADTLEQTDDTGLDLFVNLTGEVVSDLNLWGDGLFFQVFILIARSAEDQFTLSDSTEILLAVVIEDSVADSFTLSDAVIAQLSSQLDIGDSLNNWLDAIVALSPLTRVASSNLSNWADEILLNRNWAVKVTDQLYLMDRVTFNFLFGASLSDALSLSDAITIAKGNFETQGDELQFSDEIAISLAIYVPTSVGDLMNMSDAISVYISTEEDDYFRRYLEDRNMMIGELKTYYCDTMRLSDSVEVGVA